MNEAGLRLRDFEHVGTCWVCLGVSTERIALYLSSCTAADRVGARGGAAGEHECVAISELPLQAFSRIAA
jgi:hypothetical protein